MIKSTVTWDFHPHAALPMAFPDWKLRGVRVAQFLNETLVTMAIKDNGDEKDKTFIPRGLEVRMRNAFADKMLEKIPAVPEEAGTEFEYNPEWKSFQYSFGLTVDPDKEFARNSIDAFYAIIRELGNKDRLQQLRDDRAFPVPIQKHQEFTETSSGVWVPYMEHLWDDPEEVQRRVTAFDLVTPEK